MIPGPDATEAWDLGNVYVRGPRGDDKWEKRRTVPHGVHVLDVAARGDQWFAAAGIVLELGKAPQGKEPDAIACGALPIKYDALKDVVTRDGKLSLLVLKEKAFFIATTGDLASWKWHRLPETQAEPLSIEAAAGEFYLGLADGTLMKSEAAR